jgi:hypothetical protein
MKGEFLGKGRIVIVITIVLMLIPLSAYGADKLVVKNGDVTKFVVTDDPKVGIGTASPVAALHIAEENGNSVDRGVVSSQHFTGPSAAVFQFKRSRGTLASPTSLASGDSIGAFHFYGFDGTNYEIVSSVVSRVNGAVSTGNVPGELRFHTGLNSVDNFAAPKMVIGTTGIIKVKNLEGSYTNGSAFVCVNNNGELYASETACP